MPAKPKVGASKAKVGIFWDPEGFELDSLGSKEILAMTDGDTPTITGCRPTTACSSGWLM
jgi:hypothetical protein